MRLFWITAGCFLVLVLAALVVLTFWVGSYVRSREFRELIAAATGKEFRADASFSPLRWTGASVYSESATLEGHPGSGLSKLNARQIRAEVNWRAAFSGVWRVEEIAVAQVEGEWAPQPGSPHAGSSPAAENAHSPAGLTALLPNRFELGLVQIGDARLAFGDARLSGTALTIKPDGGGWLFQGKGGQLSLPHLPSLAISSFRAREQGGSFFLTQSDLRLGSNGKIQATGESPSGGKAEVAWEEVNSSDVLPPDWRGRMAGLLSGTARLTAEKRAVGTVQLRDGTLEKVPFLETVADFTGNPAFRRLPVQGASSDFRYEDGTLHLNKFSAESKGLIRAEGSLTIGKRGELDGRFEIGVAPRTLQWLPGSRDRVFVRSRDGYLWAELALGGTLEHPTEDLSPRLLTSIGTDTLIKGAKILKDAPGAAAEGVKGVLDFLRPLVP